MPKLTSSQKYMITSALDDKIALWIESEKQAVGWDRLQKQFRRQIKEAEQIIELLEKDEDKETGD